MKDATFPTRDNLPVWRRLRSRCDDVFMNGMTWITGFIGGRSEERSGLGEYAFDHPFLSSTLFTIVSLDRAVTGLRGEMVDIVYFHLRRESERE